MRIISGIYRGRKLYTLEGLKTRPTLDQTKEAIFSSIGGYLNGQVILDVFGGSGALSLESISRGAKKAYILDNNIDAIEMTSDEILEEVKKLQIDELIFKKLEDTLTTADLVKFAKANPSPTENETAFSDINSFVEESYIFHQEMEKKKAEEAKAKKNDTEKEVAENQEMEETLWIL